MNLGLDEEGVPVCEPFLAIKDVLGWSPPEFCCNGAKFHALWKKSSSENCPIESVNRPQLLICHDMYGGYLDDRFTQGSDNPDAYRFYNWSVVDTFVYFSHRFVTVPPFGWICTAHQHGVNVLGTIITEWEDGANICKQLLQSKDYIDNFVLKLVEIMVFYGFDGWLVNIENEIQSTDVPLLQYFVHQLKLKCHSHLSHAKVLWYDSITRSGKLDWQNELNAENEMFFEVSDGIFLNYALTEETLQESLKLAQTTNRQFDVYAGVDVFGRATPGGGGFNCKEIMQSILKNALSCALFAQGWTYEYCGIADFDANEQKFWYLLNDYLPQRSISLPISTSFCRGYGRKYYLEGEVVSETGWHNLSLQQLQPSYLWEFESSEAFLGGGCVKISVPDRKDLPIAKSVFKMLLSKNEPLQISTIWKIHGPIQSCDFGIALIHERKDSSSALFVMDRRDVNESSVINSVISSLLMKTPVLPENVKFVFSDKGPKDKNHGWMESSFCFDINHLLRSVEIEEAQSVELAILVVPQQATESDSESKQECLSVSFGHLKVHQRETSKDLVPIHFVRESCLLLEASFPICLSRIDTIISHECFYSRWEVPCPESVREETGISQKSHAFSKRFERLSDCETATDTQKSVVTCPHSCYFLHWKVSHDSDINFYLIFFQDGSGAEHFVGSSVSSYYIYKHKQGVGVKCPVGFTILPVLKVGSSLLGQKLKLSLH